VTSIKPHELDADIVPQVLNIALFVSTFIYFGKCLTEHTNIDQSGNQIKEKKSAADTHADALDMPMHLQLPATTENEAHRIHEGSIQKKCPQASRQRRLTLDKCMIFQHHVKDDEQKYKVTKTKNQEHSTARFATSIPRIVLRSSGTERARRERRSERSR